MSILCRLLKSLSLKNPFINKPSQSLVPLCRFFTYFSHKKKYRIYK